MFVAVLGPSRVELERGVPVELGARKPRSVLAALALRLGSDVSADAMVHLLWGEQAPKGAHGTLHSYLSGVRRVLEPGLGPRERPTVLLTGDHGYRLALRRDQLDATLFADQVRARHRALGPLASQFTTGPGPDWPSREEVSEHVDALEELLGLWTGEAYADLADLPEVQVERAALEQLRRNAEEDRVLALLALGDHAVVVAATEQATRRHPLQERVWALHALALARSGRQAESLAALRRIREVLADELGLDAGQELRDLEQAVLVQQPSLQQWLPATVTVAPVAPTSSGRSAWGTVGRADEVAALDGVLARAASGVPAYALLVGEPGIGKSRLVERTAGVAAEQGFTVLTGRCSQDDGAPPLWPWTQALGEVDASGAEEFAVWDALARQVLDRAASSPVLLVLEDLHWADTATLQVLGHLVATATEGRLAVLATRRPYPEPTGALARVGEELARRHVVRLDLAGLPQDDAEALVAEVTGTPVATDVVTAWHARSGGNPFFLVELARLGTGSDVLPATVRDVIVRRLDALGEPTRELLVLAAVLGRRCSLSLLAAVAGEDPDTVGDLLGPAMLAGLVHEPEADVVAFAHALTRDAVADTVGASRLARVHARVAHALEDEAVTGGLVAPAERVSELARHWLAAGPSHVSRAWRAAARAAEQAGEAFSWMEAYELRGAAVEAHRRDPLGTPDERFDLLIAQASDARHNSDWDLALPIVVEAIALAREAGDLDRLCEAATASTDKHVWLPQAWNELHEDAVEDLRWGLARLAPGDSAARCRLMVALAVLLFYDDGTIAEREALAEEGVAMARRIGDPALLSWAAHAAWRALWQPSNLPQRRELATEALAVAADLDDEDTEAVALATVAGTALECGDRTGFLAAYDEALRRARRRRNSYLQVALGVIEVSLAALHGDPARVLPALEHVMELQPRQTPDIVEIYRLGLQLQVAVWQPDVSEAAAGVAAFLAPGGQEDSIGRGLFVCALARGGRLEDLRALLAVPVPSVREHWASGSDWCMEAEAAAVLGDRDRAQRSVELLTPLSGRMSVSGISGVDGPIDGYLALVQATLGDRSAGATADRALTQAQEWDMPAYSRWLDEHRQRMGF